MPFKPIKFLKTSRVKLSFTNKAITAYGGFSVVAKLLEKLDFRRNVEAMIPFEETSPNATGVYAKVLRFGLTVLAGGRRFSHTMFLGDSVEIYESVFSVRRLPKSISAVTRFFNRICSYQAVEFLAERLWAYTCEHVIPWHIVKEDYLSLDSTVITRYGEQEGSAIGYNPEKKGRPSHHPLLAFLNRSQFLVNLWNRPGDTASSNNCLAFLKQTWERLKDRLQILGVLCDSGFYNLDIIKFIEEMKTPYAICVILHKILQKQIGAITAWTSVADNIDVAEFQFCHQQWGTQLRRYVVVRQKIVAGKPTPLGKQMSLFEQDETTSVNNYRYGCYITSHTEPPEQVWRTYRLRASDEWVIRENKYDFALDGFSMNRFYAVEAAMLIRTLFYNIVQAFRLQVLPDTEKGETWHTLRMKYMLIPAALGKNGKELILRLGVRAKKVRSKILWLIERIESQIPNRIAFGGNM